MLKKGLVQGLGLGLVLLLFCLPCFAEEPQQQQPEEFVITTYYPSPYGSYNELEVYRSVTYKPVNKDTLSSPKEGELVYNASDDALYLYNGSAWVAQGGGGGVLTLVGGVGVCVNCPAGWSEALFGYWNCVFASQYGNSRNASVGSCWCGQVEYYYSKAPSYGESPQNNWWFAQSHALEQESRFYRCRICVR